MDKVIRKNETMIECNAAELENICEELGLDVNVTMTPTAWAATIGQADGEVAIARFRSVLHGFQHGAYRWDRENDRVYFKADIQGSDGTTKQVRLCGTIGPGDDGRRDLTITLTKKA